MPPLEFTLPLLQTTLRVTPAGFASLAALALAYDAALLYFAVTFLRRRRRRFS